MNDGNGLSRASILYLLETDEKYREVVADHLLSTLESSEDDILDDWSDYTVGEALDSVAQVLRERKTEVYSYSPVVRRILDISELNKLNLQTFLDILDGLNEIKEKE